MDKDIIKMNIEWLRQTLRSIEDINNQIKPLINMRKDYESQIEPMIKIIKTQLNEGIINNENLIGLENIFKQKEVEVKKSIKGTKLCDLVYSILIENQTPLHFKDILSQINNKGFIVNGKDAGLNLVAHLSKDKRFKREDKRGFYSINNDYLIE